jgi:hypothetical protein
MRPGERLGPGLVVTYTDSHALRTVLAMKTSDSLRAPRPPQAFSGLPEMSNAKSPPTTIYVQAEETRPRQRCGGFWRSRRNG